MAEDTGFVPKGLMAVPLLHEEEALGVLQVLDRPQNAELLARPRWICSRLFANQAAIALDLLQRARRARTVLHSDGQDDLQAVSGLAAALDGLEGKERDTALRLLATLEELLTR